VSSTHQHAEAHAGRASQQLQACERAEEQDGVDDVQQRQLEPVQSDVSGMLDEPLNLHLASCNQVNSVLNICLVLLLLLLG
jgi:hypothetical protein